MAASSMSRWPNRSAVPRRNYRIVRQPTPPTIRNRRSVFFMNRFRFTFISASAGFLALAASAFGQSRTVVIDAGHGGYDRGGVPGQRISEKDKTLDVASRLRRLLVSDGFRVSMA